MQQCSDNTQAILENVKSGLGEVITQRKKEAKAKEISRVITKEGVVGCFLNPYVLRGNHRPQRTLSKNEGPGRGGAGVDGTMLAARLDRER